jgi:pimeloyl-ACP methyl ester carboxylesterase
MVKIDTAPLPGMTLSLLALAGLESSAESPDGGCRNRDRRAMKKNMYRPVLMGLTIVALLISALTATSYPAHAALSAHAATGSNTPVPAAPSNLTAQAVGTTSVQLTWTNNAGNQSGVVISLDGQESVDVQGATVSSYTWNGLSPNTKYWFYVASKIYGTPGDPTGYGNTQSAWVGPVYVTTAGTQPSISPAPQPSASPAPQPSTSSSSPSVTFSPPCPHIATTLSLGTTTPVLLVHGFNEGPGVWTSRERAGRRGTELLPSMAGAISSALGNRVKLFAFDYSAVNTKWVTDPSIGPRLAACIAWLATVSAEGGGRGKVVLVAHSMGGLAIRCAVDTTCVGTDRRSYSGTPWPSAAKPSQLGLVITIGTPNLGSNYQMLGSIGEALCPEISKCVQDLIDLRNTDAAKAMVPGSKQLSALPLLPVRVPVEAIAGKITYITFLFGQSSGSIPPPDPGDLVVPVYSALADQAIKKLHSGPGARTTPPINCGEIPLDNINTWLIASDKLGAPAFPVTCWHGTETTDPAFQADVVKSIQEYLAGT